MVWVDVQHPAIHRNIVGPHVLDADDAELQKVAQCDSDVVWAAVVNRGTDVPAAAKYLE